MFSKLKSFLNRNDESKVIKQSIHDLFNSERGEIVLAYLMKRYNGFNSTMDDTPELTAYNNGARDVVLSLFKTVYQDPSKLAATMQELDEGQSKE